MNVNMMDLAKLMCVVATCPSAGYCVMAQRLECGACPANPMEKPTQSPEGLGQAEEVGEGE